MERVFVRVKKIYDDAVLPKYSHYGDACFDICSNENIVIPPGKNKTIGTGLSFEVPYGHKMLIYPRSGLSRSTSIRFPNCVGVIDAGYRGQVHIIVENTSDRETYEIRKGDRIAQGEVVPCMHAIFSVVDELSSSERGEKGLGSTGI